MTWLSTGWPQVLELTANHLALSIPAIMLSLVVAVPLGRLARRWPRLGGALLAAASLLYTIPALPLLVTLPALVGLPLRSPATMILALSAYGIALLVRTSTDAFAAVDPAVRSSATAVGYSASAQFWRVELPLALPVLVAGIRVVAVSTVGLTTIGALVGIPSLGTLLTDGFQRGIGAEVATGVAMTVLIALLLDAACTLAGRVLTPWTRTGAAVGPPNREVVA